MNLLSDIDELFSKIENSLIEMDKNKSIIDKYFKELKSLINELEDSEEQHLFEYYKYIFHSKYASYLKIINKLDESKNQEKLSEKYKSGHKEYNIKNKKENLQIDPPNKDASKSKLILDENLEGNEKKLHFLEILNKQMEKLKGISNEAILQKLEECFKYIQVVPQNFSHYNQISATYESFQSLYDQCLLDLNEDSEKNSNETRNEVVQSFTMIKHIFHLQYKITRTNFMESTLNDAKMELKFFSDISRTEEKIKKRYKDLSAVFHPDKIRKWLDESQMETGRRFFAKIVDIKDDLLKKIGANSEDFSKMEENAHDYWSIALDYQNGLKKDWEKLKFLEKDHILLHTDEELKKMCAYYAKEAYNEYRGCCRIADRQCNLKKQIEFRGYMALCLYRSNKFIEAQLCAIAAIHMIMKHSNAIDGELLNWAENIFNKVKGEETVLSEQKCSEKEKSEKNEGILIKMNLTSQDLIAYKSLDIVFSFAEKKQYESKLNKNLEIISKKLLIRSEQNLIQYTSPESEILKAQERAFTFKAGGNVVMGVGLLGGGASLVAGAGNCYLAASGATLLVPPLGGIMFGIAGVVSIGLGIWGGVHLWKKGNAIKVEPEIRTRLNEMMMKALAHYGNEEYLEFLNELSKEYYNGKDEQKQKRLLKLETAGDLIDCTSVAEELLSHGFRPDGIAYLFNIIGEVLCSGKIKIKNMSEEHIKHIGMNTFFGVMNKSLEEATKCLDDRVTKMRKNSIYTKFYDFYDFMNLRDSNNIAKEFLDDAGQMPFKTRYGEMMNIAKLNIAMMKIIKWNEEELKLARDLLNECKQSIEENYQFIPSLKLRQELLEDFLWIVSGKTDENEMENKEKKVQEVLKLEHSDNYLRFLDEELQRFEKDDIVKEVCNTLNKIAAYYAKQAQKESINKIKGFELWQSAQKYYELSLRRIPEQIESILGFARCLLNLCKYKATIDFLGKNYLEENSEFWLLLSQAKRKQCNYQKANEFILESLKRNNRNEEAIRDKNLIETYLKNKKTGILSKYREKPQEQFFRKLEKEREKIYKVLSIDGGGVRGIIPALWLTEIERATHRQISKMFQMMSGVSTGAIIALGLSTSDSTLTGMPKYSALDIVDLYLDEAKNIFTKPSIYKQIVSGKSLLNPDYTNDGRLNLFNKYFKNLTLKDMMNEVVVPACYEQNLLRTYSFTKYDALNEPSKNESLVDVLMATTAAPTFFPSYNIAGKGIFVDGGCQVNHPAMLCYDEALRYKVPKENLFVLSLGTGSYIPDPLNPDTGRGLLFWGTQFHKFVLPAQEGNTDNFMFKLLGEKKYKRWQIFLENPISLDDYSENSMNKLLDIGYQSIEEAYSCDDNSMNKIIEFLASDAELI